MVLSLQSPVANDFMKDWPSQNANNSDEIDAYAGPFAIQSYIPILDASTGGLALGSGTITGNYYRIFDQIFTWGEFRFGAGFSAGTGTFEITLPFDANTITPPNTGSGSGPIIGSGLTWDGALANRQPVTTQLRTASKIMFSVKMESGAGGRALGLAIPFAWSSGSGINWTARYQRVPT